MRCKHNVICLENWRDGHFSCALRELLEELVLRDEEG